MYDISNLLMENFLGPRNGMDRAGDRAGRGCWCKENHPGQEKRLAKLWREA